MSNWAERASASLLPLSRASTLGAALKEWTYTGRFFDLEAADGTCELCGQQELRYHFFRDRERRHVRVVAGRLRVHQALRDRRH